jgi:hypothetical protein
MPNKLRRKQYYLVQIHRYYFFDTYYESKVVKMGHVGDQPPSARHEICAQWRARGVTLPRRPQQIVRCYYPCFVRHWSGIENCIGAPGCHSPPYF